MAVVALVGLFVLAALWIVTRSPSPSRMKLAKFLGLEIEGGGFPTGPDQHFHHDHGSASDAAGANGAAVAPAGAGGDSPRRVVRFEADGSVADDRRAIRGREAGLGTAKVEFGSVGELVGGTGGEPGGVTAVPGEAFARQQADASRDLGRRADTQEVEDDR